VNLSAGTKAFAITVRVYYEDTDAGGVVYYANYLRFMERARTEWLRAMGFEQDKLAATEDVLFAVRSATVDFIKPARFNEALDVTVEIKKRGHASMTFDQVVVRGKEVLCRGEVRVACLSASSFAPRPLPHTLVKRLDQDQGA